MKVLLIGQDDRAEMQPIVDWLRERTTADELCRYPSPGSYVEQIRFNWHPDLAVVLESHPDEYTSAEVMQLFSAVPLARIVCCAGVWSESAGRTRKIWPLAVRVAAVHALPRLEREWKLLSGQRSDFRLPATGSREEWFAAQHPASAAEPSGWEMTVRVESADAAYRQMLIDLLIFHRQGVASAEKMSADAILWDADPWHISRTDELRRLSVSGPVIALSGWVTTDLHSELLHAGAQALVHKLSNQAQLLDCLWSVAVAAVEP